MMRILLPKARFDKSQSFHLCHEGEYPVLRITGRPSATLALAPGASNADNPSVIRPDKEQVLRVLRERLTTSLERLTAAQRSVQSGAVHAEARQEHPKDTRSIEAGYLARGLAERVETLRDGIQALDLLRPRDFAHDEVAAPGALVTLLDDEGSEAFYFLSPAGGGESIAMEGHSVLVLTPRSPLGAAIAGKRRGGTIAVDLPSRTLRAEILRVA